MGEEVAADTSVKEEGSDEISEVSLRISLIIVIFIENQLSSWQQSMF